MARCGQDPARCGHIPALFALILFYYLVMVIAWCDTSTFRYCYCCNVFTSALSYIVVIALVSRIHLFVKIYVQIEYTYKMGRECWCCMKQTCELMDICNCNCVCFYVYIMNFNRVFECVTKNVINISANNQMAYKFTYLYEVPRKDQIIPP